MGSNAVDNLRPAPISSRVGVARRRRDLRAVDRNAACWTRWWRAAAVVVTLPLLFSASSVHAGELSEVPATTPPALSLTDLAGQQRSLDEFTGNVVLLNFWASWCTPCIEEMPSLQRLDAAMRGRPFAIVSVNVGEAKRRVQVNVKRLGIRFPVLLDKDQAAFEGWGATVLPTAYLLGRDGRTRFVGRGPVEWDRADIVDLVRKMADTPVGDD